MSETEIERMVVRLVGDPSEYLGMLKESTSATKEAAGEVQAAAGRIEGFTNSLKGFAAGALSALSALGLKGMMQEAFGAFSEAEDAVINLESVLSANGRNVEQLSARYQAFAADMQNLTSMSDEAILAQVRMAESFDLTGVAAEHAVKQAIGLADVAGSNTNSMIRLTAAMEKGDVKRAMMFARMVPQLRGVKNEQEFLAKYAKLTAAGFDAVQRKAQTGAGQIRGLKEAYNDLQEQFGEIISEGVKPVVREIKSVVMWFQGLNREIKFLIAAIGGLVVAILAIGPALSLIGLMAPLVFNPLTVALLAAGAATTLWIASVGGIARAWEQITSTVKDFVSANSEILETIGKTAAAVIGAVIAFKALKLALILTIGLMKLLHITQLINIALWIVWKVALLAAKIILLAFFAVIVLVKVAIITWNVLLAISTFLVTSWGGVILIAKGAILLMSGALLVAKGATWLLNAALTVMNSLLVAPIIIAAAAAALLLVAAYVAIRVAIEAVKSAVLIAYESVVELGEGFKTLGSAASGPIKAIKDTFAGLGEVLGGAWALFKYDMKSAFDLLQSYVKLVMAKWEVLWTPLWNFIADGFSALVDFLSALLSSAAAKFKTGILAALLEASPLERDQEQAAELRRSAERTAKMEREAAQRGLGKGLVAAANKFEKREPTPEQAQKIKNAQDEVNKALIPAKGAQLFDKIKEGFAPFMPLVEQVGDLGKFLFKEAAPKEKPPIAAAKAAKEETKAVAEREATSSRSAEARSRVMKARDIVDFAAKRREDKMVALLKEIAGNTKKIGEGEEVGGANLDG